MQQEHVHVPAGHWMPLASHKRWLVDQASALVRFARASRLPSGGFGWLDDDGMLDASQPVQTWITCRMTHVFALSHLRGEPGAGSLIDHGVAALRGLLHDDEHGGWYASVPGSAQPSAQTGFTGAAVRPRGLDDTKAAYPHAFVVLAASSATVAGRPGAAELLDEALAAYTEHFLDEQGRVVESYDRTWNTAEAYRGANSSMHTVEAFLAAGDATGDPRWHQRALRIAEQIVHGFARGNDWRLLEHFTADWQPVPDFNAEVKGDQFRPYGTTPGHSLEWARLLLHLEAALPDPPGWLLPDARALFGTAVERGWAVDGADGFVYTLDWDDTPVVRERMHWVVAEAISVAAALVLRTGEAAYEELYRTFWDYAATYLIDTQRGSWRHELSAGNEPSGTVWAGKPDVYHAYQATLIPQLPLAPGAAKALADRMTRG